MRTKLNKILKDLVSQYDGASDYEGKANALVLIQTALVNLINFNQVELGNNAVKESNIELKGK
jgi:hypothetical protein